GVPLADLVQARPDPSHAAAAVGRYGELPCDVEVDHPSRGERARQLHPHHRSVLGAPELPAGGPKALDRDPADESLAGEVEYGATREVQWWLVQDVGHAVLREDVLLDLHPQEAQRVGRMVFVMDPLATLEEGAR